MKRAPLPLLLGLVLVACRFAGAAETNHDFARWEKEIAAYEQSDRTNPPPQHGIVFIGSSTIRMWTSLARDFPGLPVLNRGFGGSEIADSTHFADRVLIPYHPKMVFLRAGGNDIAAGKSAEQVFDDFKAFLTKVHAALPETEIVFISWSPSISRWKQADKEKALNNMVKDYIDAKPRLNYLDAWDVPLGPDGKPRAELFRADKLHFNAAGYKLLAERVRSWLESRKKQESQ